MPPVAGVDLSEAGEAWSIVKIRRSEDLMM
jgi:hypothetical protein